MKKLIEKLKSVTRFTFDTVLGTNQIIADSCQDGNYVLYSDVMKIIEEFTKERKNKPKVCIYQDGKWVPIKGVSVYFVPKNRE